MTTPENHHQSVPGISRTRHSEDGDDLGQLRFKDCPSFVLRGGLIVYGWFFCGLLCLAYIIHGYLVVGLDLVSTLVLLGILVWPFGMSYLWYKDSFFAARLKIYSNGIWYKNFVPFNRIRKIGKVDYTDYSFLIVTATLEGDPVTEVIWKVQDVYGFLWVLRDLLGEDVFNTTIEMHYPAEVFEQFDDAHWKKAEQYLDFAQFTMRKGTLSFFNRAEMTAVSSRINQHHDFPKPIMEDRFILVEGMKMLIQAFLYETENGRSVLPETIRKHLNYKQAEDYFRSKNFVVNMEELDLLMKQGERMKPDKEMLFQCLYKPVGTGFIALAGVMLLLVINVLVLRAFT